jgi:hypothetical protein
VQFFYDSMASNTGDDEKTKQVRINFANAEELEHCHRLVKQQLKT